MHRSLRPSRRAKALGAVLPAFILTAAGPVACDEFDDDLDGDFDSELREAPAATPEAEPASEPAQLETRDVAPDASDPTEDPPTSTNMALHGEDEPEGALDEDIIRRIVRAHINEIRHCYNQLLTDDPKASGRVEVQFKISPDGDVPVAVIGESTIDDEALLGCMATAVKRWKFPKPRGGGKVQVTYPFVLSPD